VRIVSMDIYTRDGERRWSRRQEGGSFGRKHCGLPDHEFIITAAVGMVRIGSRENVIRNVCPNIVRRIIIPLDARLHIPGPLHRNALCKLAASINIAFHIVLGALPCPFTAESNSVPGCAVEVGALVTGRCGVFAPEIVEDFVAVDSVVGVLRTEADALLAFCYGVCGWGSFEG